MLRFLTQQSPLELKLILQAIMYMRYDCETNKVVHRMITGEGEGLKLTRTDDEGYAFYHAKLCRDIMPPILGSRIPPLDM